MLFISQQGVVDAERIRVKIFPAIERGNMDIVRGIIVHQTGAATASSTFHSYQVKGANGAHFLIDLDGTIYQTASLKKVTNHVGKIKSRCIQTHKCEPAEIKSARQMRGIDALYRHEIQKDWPKRFPSNGDSLGIELVGMYNDNGGTQVYQNPTNEQNAALKWLIAELLETLGVSRSEVFRHPEVSYKADSEARGARW
jgi:N-acetyl-anhydromuramyl-L-alanine amidase AmpD